MGYHFLLQGIFLTQGSNPGLLHWQEGCLSLSHLGSPCIWWLPPKTRNQTSLLFPFHPIISKFGWQPSKHIENLTSPPHFHRYHRRSKHQQPLNRRPQLCPAWPAAVSRSSPQATLLTPSRHEDAQMSAKSRGAGQSGGKRATGKAEEAGRHLSDELRMPPPLHRATSPLTLPGPHLSPSHRPEGRLTDLLRWLSVSETQSRLQWNAHLPDLDDNLFLSLDNIQYHSNSSFLWERHYIR